MESSDRKRIHSPDASHVSSAKRRKFFEHDSNIYNAARSTKKKTGPRPIIIDGCNVAFEFGKHLGSHPKWNEGFAKLNAKGVQMVVEYFKNHGHKDIHVLIPAFRAHHPHTLNPDVIAKLKTEGIVHLTPSRSCVDRYIVQLACELDGVIVSNNRFRDIMEENAEWKRTVEQRLLLFNFVGDVLIFPQDPRGRNGPTLDSLLSF